ncbi:hypothetical protein J1605_001960 [Eschrichtius robustus]|uniref:Uncharacterized protein n=1 Tax=Eschrichtius robustus TaxID=9764 RepID=A0AB34GRL3_ESCRO|nr:hypothetical protein J1605_010424 [Eschrichtius robustus]KAJ8796889.1 hypothetical protein J1605_001960 [Eschrichtius robustus]
MGPGLQCRWMRAQRRKQGPKCPLPRPCPASASGWGLGLGTSGCLAPAPLLQGSQPPAPSLHSEGPRAPPGHNPSVPSIDLHRILLQPASSSSSTPALLPKGPPPTPSRGSLHSRFQAFLLPHTPRRGLQEKQAQGGAEESEEGKGCTPGPDLPPAPSLPHRSLLALLLGASLPQGKTTGPRASWRPCVLLASQEAHRCLPPVNMILVQSGPLHPEGPLSTSYTCCPLGLQDVMTLASRKQSEQLLSDDPTDRQTHGLPDPQDCQPASLCPPLPLLRLPVDSHCRLLVRAPSSPPCGPLGPPLEHVSCGRQPSSQTPSGARRCLARLRAGPQSQLRGLQSPTC